MSPVVVVINASRFVTAHGECFYTPVGIRDIEVDAVVAVDVTRRGHVPRVAGITRDRRS